MVDIVSLGDSVYTFALKPSWINAGFLLWDTVAVVVQMVPGSYMAKIPREVMRHVGKRTKIAVRSEKISKYTPKIKKGFSSPKSGVESLGRGIKSSKVGKWFSNKAKKLSTKLSGIKKKVSSAVGGGGNSPKKPKKTKVAKGSSNTTFGKYILKEGIDVDLRGKGTYKDALEMAFEKNRLRQEKI